MQRPRLTSSVARALCAVALTAVSAIPAHAQLTSMVRNGSAALNGSDQLVLTPASGGTGSAWLPTAIATSGLQTLTATFQFYIGGGSGADGLAFVLQGNGTGALGGGGGGIGWQGIDNSLGALFRTYVYNAVQIGTDGQFDGNSVGKGGLRSTNDVVVSYDAPSQLFSVAMNGSTVLTQNNVDLAALVGPQAYVGFTAATGGATDEHRINSFSIVTTAATSVPEPTTVALMGTGLLAIAAGAYRRRRAA